MNDPISQMTKDEIEQACREFVGAHPTARDEHVVGLMIQKLQEWGIQFSWHPCEGWMMGGSCYYSKCLQSSFLRQAIILGHWSPPVKELTIEERLSRVEKILTNPIMWESPR